MNCSFISKLQNFPKFPRNWPVYSKILISSTGSGRSCSSGLLWWLVEGRHRTMKLSDTQSSPIRISLKLMPATQTTLLEASWTVSFSVEVTQSFHNLLFHIKKLFLPSFHRHYGHNVHNVLKSDCYHDLSSFTRIKLRLANVLSV